jgi:hypothetical protein
LPPTGAVQTVNLMLNHLGSDDRQLGPLMPIEGGIIT